VTGSFGDRPRVGFGADEVALRERAHERRRLEEEEEEEILIPRRYATRRQKHNGINTVLGLWIVLYMWEHL